MAASKSKLSAKATADLMETLKERFLQNTGRHKSIEWKTVETTLKKHNAVLQAIAQMEETGGEPDVVTLKSQKGKIVFADCSPESPEGRRSLCFDKAALDSRKKDKPRGSAQQMAASMGIEILSEQEYRELQELGKFDQKTSSWVQTPDEIRKLGGALFCDRRYNTVFLYHNGAESYYASRGFRGRVLLS